MKARAELGFVWLGVTTLIVLAARSLAYALAEPTDLSHRLEGSAGGPAPAILAPVAIGIAAALSSAIVWLVALGVRERQRLQPRRTRLCVRPRRIALRSVGLFVGSSLAFALLESYVHWRAGIGFHGFLCLLGPVHRDAVPLLAGLALVAASLTEAGQHLVAWLKATVLELVPRPLVWSVHELIRAPRLLSPGGTSARADQPRAPPLPA